MLENKSAFSLVELMVVVSLIGILAAIGIPKYSKFQAKTRQTEAKSSLTALYTAEESFRSEWNMYTEDLHNMGFGVKGQNLHYMVGFEVMGGCVGYDPSNGAPDEYGVVGGGTVASADLMFSRQWSCGSEVNVSKEGEFNLPSSIPYDSVNKYCTRPAGFVMLNPFSFCVQNNFNAKAVGDPNSNVGAIPIDAWTINAFKVLQNDVSGIQ